MIGKRRDFEDGELLESGEYGKYSADNVWYGVPPNTDLLARLANHDIVEHEDGTITVSPSILCTGYYGKQWHGYLERGVWREV